MSHLFSPRVLLKTDKIKFKESAMIHPEWMSIILYSYLFVLITHALASCLVPLYYKNIPFGRLTHSQLRVKQGSAEFEHRANVFVHSLVFGVIKGVNIFIAVILAVIVNFFLLVTG